MKIFLTSIFKKDPGLIFGILILISISILSLRSIAPFVFPVYWAYLIIGIIAFLTFAAIGYDILSVFSWQIYVGCVIFLIIPLLIGHVTRGTVRWIPIGPITLQPAEIVKPFLLIFFSNYLSGNILPVKKLFTSLLLLFIPIILIVIQPSLGVSVLNTIGFLGVLLASSFSKRKLFLFFLGAIFLLPVVWFFMAPYQKNRVVSFLAPTNEKDFAGAGYNSLQSMISVGSGKIFGRGLGKGVQTQLAFLPERHTDFIFASISEEMGFLGAFLVLITSFFVLFRISGFVSNAKTLSARMFCAGIFLTLFAQVLVHVGMNLGLFPITGVPLPLVSAGGSSLLATMIALGMVAGSREVV